MATLAAASRAARSCAACRRRVFVAGSDATSRFSRSTRSAARRSIRANRPPRVNERADAGERSFVPSTAISSKTTNPSETSAVTLSVNSRSNAADCPTRKSESP